MKFKIRGTAMMQFEGAIETPYTTKEQVENLQRWIELGSYPLNEIIEHMKIYNVKVQSIKQEKE